MPSWWHRLLCRLGMHSPERNGNCYYCGHPNEEMVQANREERVMMKISSLRERHDVLRDALRGLVQMHQGPPDAVGNWDWALEKAAKALALADAPWPTETKGTEDAK